MPKGERITIKLNKDDLDKVILKAKRLRIPYQSLIGSVILRYVNNNLVDTLDMTSIAQVLPSIPKGYKIIKQK